MKNPLVYGIGSLLLAAGGGAVCSGAAAPLYPTSVIRFIVPGGASTPPDIVSRVIANELSSAEGWSVIVEDRPGALQTIAGSVVLKQPADGYSLYITTLQAAAAPALMPSTPFSLTRDFAPVIRASVSYNVLVVNPSVPANSVSELVAFLKRQPNKVTFSSNGFGTPAHLAGEMFKLRAGVNATHVPYQQMSQAISDLIAGRNQFQFIAMSPVVDLIKAGRLRALAVTGPIRVTTMPEVPTLVEAGLVVEDWVGLSVKAGTPDDIVLRLNDAINKALTRPSAVEMLARVGARPAGGTPLDYGEFMKFQITQWSRVIKDSDIRVEQ
jgi:tripartite-type tricarboxylate transporter receptor subunit TctC